MPEQKPADQLIAENATLAQENSLLKTEIEEKDKRIADLELDVQSLQTKYEDTLTANEALVAEFDKKPAAAAPVKKVVPSKEYKKLRFEYDGQQKGFNYPSINHKGKKITAEEIAADKDLQKEFIDRNSGMIKHF